MTEKQWQFLEKLNMQLMCSPATVPLGIYPIKTKIISHKNLYMNVYCNFSHNSHKLETTQMSMNMEMVKQTVIYPYHRILLSSKKEQTIDTHI